MEIKKVLIVGGVAGGATAAARLRRINENIEIIMFERGGHISFANCGLPYYIGDVIKEKERLLVQTPEGMKNRFNIDVRVNSEVLAIYPDSKEIEVLDKSSNTTYRESYDKLILSPGAEPVRPSIPGIESDKVFTLRNIPDTYKIKDYINNNKVKRAVIIGAGYIGIEMAENIHKLGINTTIVELSDHVMGPLDYDMAAIVHHHMKTKKVEFYLNDSVEKIDENNDSLSIQLRSGKEIKCDLAVLSVGVKPEIKLAKNAGLKIGERGGIEVNEYLQTSDTDIYAVGDAVEVVDYINKSKVIIPLAGPANKQGRIAANNIFGQNEKYEGTQGTSIIKVFDITVAGTGNNETVLKKNSISYLKTYIHSMSHVGYYPDATTMSIKLLFSPNDGKVLGAQIIGFDGVDKRIDVIATAIRAGMTVFDLEKLELAYAPPYSSAKDPVNLAAFTAANIIKGDHEVIHWNEIESRDKNKTILVDVRTPIEYKMGTIEDAVNIPVDEVRNRLNEFTKDKKIILFCRIGLRAYIAYRILKQNGFDAVNLSGGYLTYQYAKENQSNPDIFEYENATPDEILKSPESEVPYEDYSTTKNNVPDNNHSVIKVDACGLQCPGPIIETYNKINEMKNGDTIEVRATDPGFEADIKVWCEQTGNQLLNLRNDGKVISAVIKKVIQNNENSVQQSATAKTNEKTLIVFSNDLDKAIASFIIANGAVAMGSKVTMFFTFWGLNILKKSKHINVPKNFIEKMFDYMLPKSSEKLKLSKMNMGGIGGKLIRHIMKAKKVPSLEELIEQARNLGVKFIACNMSMDLMGIKREELIDGVEVGGVATFIGSADRSNMSLFI